MLRFVVPSGWYGDVAGVAGDYVSLIPDSHLQTSRGRFELPGENVLYVRAELDGPTMKVTGVGGASDLAWTYPDLAPQGWKSHGMAHGVSACIFNHAAALLIATPTQGSQGYRYINDQGQPVTGDDTYNSGTALALSYGLTDLWEWTKQGDLFAGQNANDECILKGVDRRVLESGSCRFIRFRRIGNACAVALWKPAENCTVFHWFTVDEIASLPLESGVEPEPTPERPTCTIVSYPMSIVQGDPMVVTADYGGGQADVATWLYRTDGDDELGETVWITAARQSPPERSFDYGPHLTDWGAYNIALRVEGPGGSDETLSERIITVLERSPEPEPQPEPDMIYSDEKFQEYIDSAATLLHQVRPERPYSDQQQSCREMGDRYRGAVTPQNPTVSELFWSDFLRAGSPPIDATKLDAVVAKLVAEQERLQAD